jgi:hypothetical protein
MALVTINAVPNVIIVTAVFRISCGLRVAERALEYRVVRWVRMACGTHAVGPAMTHGKKVMGERCSQPGRGGMARSACGRESGRDMVRIGCGLVRRLMAAVTICRQRREVVVHVAARARN